MSAVRHIGQRSAPLTDAASNVPYMCRIFETATETITSIGVDFANWIVNGGAEVALTGTLSVLGASVEYPAGTFTALTFGGSTSASCASGGDILGDIVPCQTIPAGAKYFIRWLWQSTTQVGYIAQFNGSNPYVAGGDAIEQTATNKVLSGTVNDSGTGAGMYPTVIKTITAKQVPAIIGDSREAGTNVVSDATGIVGSVSQGIASYTAYLKLAVGGETAAGYLANSTRRLALQQAYTDFTISAYGINDIYGLSHTAAALAASQQSLAARTPGKRFYVTTLAPVTGTNDSWQTLLNQTLGAHNADVEAYNPLVLAGLGGAITGTLDIRAAFESGLTSGKWLVNGAANAYTSDGTHPQRLANSGVVIPSASIFPPTPPTGLPKYQMQACSSSDSTLKSWLSDSPDFAGVGFPGPGAPLDIVKYATKRAIS